MLGLMFIIIKCTKYILKKIKIEILSITNTKGKKVRYGFYEL